MARLVVATVLLAAALAGCANNPRARFGLISGLSVVETRHVPYEVGTHYGFRVDYHDFGKSLILREEFHSPAPAHWRSSAPPRRRMLTPDGKTMTCEVELGSHTPAPPEIHSMYVEDIQIARGDPRGQYTVKLWLDGKPFKQFEYVVE